MNWEKQREDYKTKAIEFAKEWREDVSEHILDIMVSVMLTRDGILQGGGFVQAIVLNDLYSAVTRADNDCINHIKLITLTNKNCYLNDL